MSSSEENRKERSETPGANLDPNAAAIAGANRKSGVIWTTDARNDMFRRRENNESWESICKDYPARSRHAMQQQYSMMKKQKMMAEGTWTTNRRGRKRKQPVLPGVSAGFPRRESGMDDTEADMSVTPSDFEVDDLDDMVVDEMDMGTPGPDVPSPAIGGVQGVLDFNRDPRSVTGRPSPLSRSATDPAPAPRGRGGGRGRGGRVASSYATESHPPPLAPKSFTPVNAVNMIHEHPAIKPGKRPLNDSNSLSPASKRVKPIQEAVTHEDDAVELAPEPVAPFSTPMVLFTQEHLTEFFRAGVHNAEQAKKALDTEQAQRELAAHESVNRANRRAREAEDRLKDLSYRHRGDVRGVEEMYKERLSTVQQGHADQIRDLETKLIIARSKIPVSVENGNKAPDASQGTEVPFSSELMTLIGGLEDLKARYETEQKKRKDVEARVAALEKELNEARQKANVPVPALSGETVLQLQQLQSLLKTLEVEANDISPRALTQRLTDANVHFARLAGGLVPSPHPHSVQQAPHMASPHMPGPPPVIPPHQLQSHNASLAPRMHQHLPPSASPSPVPDHQGIGRPPTSQPAITINSETPPFGTPPYHEQKRSHPVSIHNLISQEPSRPNHMAHNTLPPMNNMPPRQPSPQNRSPLPLPPPAATLPSQHSVPTVESPRPRAA